MKRPKMIKIMTSSVEGRQYKTVQWNIQFSKKDFFIFCAVLF